MVFRIQYDFGSSTCFEVICLSKVYIVSDHATYPKLIEEDTVNVAIYNPPEGSPNLNELFPNLNQFLFGADSIVQWMILFHISSNCGGGAIEAGPNAMGDLVFAPYKFGSLGEMLVALEKGSILKADPGFREDAVSRMIFPMTLPEKDEAKYQAFKADLDNFH